MRIAGPAIFEGVNKATQMHAVRTITACRIASYDWINTCIHV